MSSSRKLTASLGAFALVSSGVALAAAAPAVAATGDAAPLVISEAYGGGGNGGATLKNDFVELYNPTDAAISVDDMSIQYRSSGAGATSGTLVTELSGSVPAQSHYLVQEAAGDGGSVDLPSPDATGTTGMSGSAFTVYLVDGTEKVVPPVGDAAGTDGIVDLLGVDSNTFETAKAAGISAATSSARLSDGVDTDDNSADFATGDPTPTNSAGETAGDGGGDGGDPTDPPTEFTGSIADIQGDGATSPHVGDIATTTGVVTAAYPSGGFYGYVIQTPGTGAGTDATPSASDAIYVYQPRGTVDVTPGDYVEVTGEVSEYGDPQKGGTLTELAVDKTDVTPLSAAHEDVTALAGDYPTTDAAREAHESELLDVSGQRFTVTNNYTTNQYAEIGLATGDTPLISPTEVEDAQTGDIAGVEADNAARAVTLDDGASINFLPFDGHDNQDIPLPWLSQDNPVRVSSQATFHEPVILDWRNNTWKFQPTHRVTDEGTDVVTFSDTRAENAAPQDVGGDLRLATFNVLNYFPTTGEEFVADGGTCSYYVDRTDDPVTDNRCNPDGPRGAAEDEDLQRQQTKIVNAINTMDADIVSLEEIENSVKFDKDRDDALSTLVDALNTDAGSTRWAYVASPDAADLPSVEEQDVIRTAFIYDPATVEAVGDSEVLTGSAPFADAREPLAQAFKPAGGAEDTTFGVIVNHFKSKGSGDDDGTGQGNANPDRVAQAHALADFAEGFEADRGISKLFLTGDYNAYTMEDPIQALESEGYTNLESDQADEWSYNYGGMAGSLDHVFANEAALDDVTGVDIWNINADEAVAFEYSRYNYNATLFYQENQFRASDHDPEVIGIDVPGFGEDGEISSSTVTAKATPRTVTAGQTRVKVHVAVSSDGEQTPTGTVTVNVDGQSHTADLGRSGRARVRLAAFDTAGTRTVEVSYSGDENTASSSTSVEVDVRAKRGHGNGHGHGDGDGHGDGHGHGNGHGNGHGHGGGHH